MDGGRRVGGEVGRYGNRRDEVKGGKDNYIAVFFLFFKISLI